MPRPQHPRVASSDWSTAVQQIAALQQRGELAAADARCRELLAQRTDPALLHLHGVVSMQLGDLAGAAAALQRALSLTPESVQLLACAALVEVRAGRFEAGGELYRRALRLEPRHRDALCGHGAALQQQGQVEAAREAFAACAAAHPGFAEAWCNLGGAEVALGRVAEAEAAYRRAVQAAPGFAAAHQGLVWVLTTSGQTAARAAAVRAWAAACPEHPAALHLSRSLQAGPPPDRCPAGFVVQHFDEFAPVYDDVLRQLATAVADAFAAMWRQQRLAAMRVLDLGCGTGSGSEWLRAEGRRLVGVDLSRGMLERAAARGLYDELHCGDIAAFVAATAARFDAVLLADVLPYFGELRPLFAGVARCLDAGGAVLASYETAATPLFTLAATGRFQHHADAVRAAAVANGFAVLCHDAAVLRREGGRPVEGGIVLLRRR